MANLKPSDWTAIKWYMEEYGYTIKDMMVWPNVRFRDSKDQIKDINIDHIKSKYVARNKNKKKISA